MIRIITSFLLSFLLISSSYAADTNSSIHLMSTNTALARKLAHEGIQIIELGDSVTLVLATDDLFQLGTRRFKQRAYEPLNDIINILKKTGNAEISIQGYTDNVAGMRQNLRLSERQAQTILSHFWAHGIDFSRMTAIGYGQADPIASNMTMDGSSMNRRVEIHWKRQA